MGEAKRRAAGGGANVPPHPNPSDERRIVWALAHDGKTLVLGLSDACITMLREGGITDIEFKRGQHPKVPFDLSVMVFSAPTRAKIMEMIGQGNRMRAEPAPEDVTAGDFRWETNPAALDRVVRAAARYLRERGVPANPADDTEWLKGLIMAQARGEP